MKYYIETIEQITKEDGSIEEYAGIKSYGTLTEAEVKYHEKLMNVINALGKTHLYMYIRIINSYGVVADKNEYTVGAYQNETPEQQKPVEE
jgi:hypothetical protein